MSFWTFRRSGSFVQNFTAGVGVACGLKAKPVYKDSLLKSIQLSQGVALTTDGDLLTLKYQ
jgi:hypothetical protein